MNEKHVKVITTNRRARFDYHVESKLECGIALTGTEVKSLRDGSAQLTVDSRGRPTSQIEPKITPRSGNAIRLTLDLSVQRAAEQALRYGIRVAHDNQQWAADGGAVVAIDPRDGAVLALASYPTYQPSVYVNRDPSNAA